MDKGLKVLHTANAGVLIIIGRNTLGVDLFSQDPEGLYPDTPEEVRQELLNRIERKEIQTLLFTHGHGDHFCLQTVLEALHRNPGLTVISTEEVVQRIREKVSYAGIMIAVDSQETGNHRIEFPGFSLELFNSKHMGEQYAGVQNLTCMLEAGGKRILVPGDAWPEPELFERISKWSLEIDLLLAPFPLIGLPSSRRMIDRALQVRQILAFHLPRPEADTQNWIASAKAVCARSNDHLPMPVFGEKLGKEYCF